MAVVRNLLLLLLLLLPLLLLLLLRLLVVPLLRLYGCLPVPWVSPGKHTAAHHYLRDGVPVHVALLIHVRAWQGVQVLLLKLQHLQAANGPLTAADAVLRVVLRCGLLPPFAFWP
jgi:hypothetical protein